MDISINDKVNCSDGPCGQVRRVIIKLTKEEFVPAFMTTFNALPYMMRPYYVPMLSNIPLEKEHIPADELVIRRGTQVQAIDSHIGRVDEFLINPENDRITHLVIGEGLLWGQKDFAPSDELRQWFGHNPAMLDEFKRRYFAELDQNPMVRQTILSANQHRTATLLYSSRELEHNNAIVWKAHLEDRPFE